MTRPLILFVLGLVLAGCKSQPPTADPCFGRTTIPPPQTGSATGQAIDPCCQGAPLAQGPMPLRGAPPQTSAGIATQAPAFIGQPQVQMPSQPSAVSSTYPQMPPGVAAGTASQAVSPPASGFGLSSPRPTSTLPGAYPPARSAPPASPSVSPPTSPSGPPSPYAPPGGSFDYRGSSLQGPPVPLVPSRPEMAPPPATTNVSVSRTIAPPDERMPKPVDDTSATANAGGRKPIIRTIPPRTKDDSSGPLVDIMDLPKAGGSAADAKTGGPLWP